VFRDLGVRMGVSEPDHDGLGESAALLDTAAKLPDGMASVLYEKGIAPGPALGRPVQFVDVFPKTADRKAHLFPSDVTATHGLYTFQPDPATADAPLTLISPASEKTISSTLGELRTRPAELMIHPDDARLRGIEEGDHIRVFNALGEVRCLVNVGPVVRPGTVSLSKGLWSRSTENGSTATALVPDTLTDIGAGACFNDARVQVERIEVEDAETREANSPLRVH
jgi:anaerobic selenocysteine-containing dehydrogenase